MTVEQGNLSLPAVQCRAPGCSLERMTECLVQESTLCTRKPTSLGSSCLGCCTQPRDLTDSNAGTWRSVFNVVSDSRWCRTATQAIGLSLQCESGSVTAQGQPLELIAAPSPSCSIALSTALEISAINETVRTGRGEACAERGPLWWVRRVRALPSKRTGRQYRTVNSKAASHKANRE